jgi:flagellar protein FliS
MTAYSRGGNVAAYQSVATHGGVAASDPHRLILMLMDGALERIAKARGCIEHGRLSEKTPLLHRSIEIVEELRGSLDMVAGGKIADNLADLYDYMCRQLLKATLENRAELLTEVSGLLQTLRTAWSEMPLDSRTGRTGAR